MTKKRFLAMLLTGAMTLSLAACGGTSTGSDAGTDSGADSGSDSYKIALIQQHQTNAFQIAVMPSCSSLLIRTALLMLQSPQLIPALL